MKDDPDLKLSLQVVADAERLLTDVDRALKKGRNLLATVDVKAAKRQFDGLDKAEQQQAAKQFEQELHQFVDRNRTTQGRAVFGTQSSTRSLRKVRNMI